MLFAAFLCVCGTHAQRVTIEPLGEFGVYARRTHGIMDVRTGDAIRSPQTTRYEGIYILGDELIQTKQDKVDYYVTTGFRVSVHKFSLESENVISCTTNNFLKNKPYLAEFYLRLNYRSGKFKIGYEHLCIHPIRSESLGMKFAVRGGHDKFFVKFNM